MTIHLKSILVRLTFLKAHEVTIHFVLITLEAWLKFAFLSYLVRSGLTRPSLSSFRSDEHYSVKPWFCLLRRTGLFQGRTVSTVETEAQHPDEFCPSNSCFWDFLFFSIKS